MNRRVALFSRGLRDALDDLEALLARLVANHSGARFEARMRGLASEMAEFQIERSTVADSLSIVI